MTDDRKPALDALRTILEAAATSYENTMTPAASKARIDSAVQLARNRHMIAMEAAAIAKRTAALAREPATKKRRRNASNEPRGSAGGKARSASHPMRKVENAFADFYKRERANGGWTKNSAGKFGRMMRIDHGVSARYASELARKLAKAMPAE